MAGSVWWRRRPGCARRTVSRGVTELDSGQEPLGRTRRPGGGRKKAADLDPGLRPALMALVEPDVRGDPMSPLRWTTQVDPDAGRRADPGRAHGVAPTPSATCCARRASACRATPRRSRAPSTRTATRSSATSTSRPRPTRRPGSRWSAWTPRRRNWSASSSNAGRQWRPTGEPVEVQHPRLPRSAAGQGHPVRDLRPGREHRLGQRRHRPRHRRVRRGLAPPLVGRGRPGRTTRHATPAADHRRCRRLQRLPHPRLEGRTGRPRRRNRPGDHRLPPPARHLQVEQDRAPAVLPHHHELARPAADQPRGHREQHRRDHHPHRAHGSHAELDTDTYPTGVRISDEQMAALPLARHDWHGDWNYTLRPEPYPQIPDRRTGSVRPAQPRPAWLCHPTVTGLTAPEWDALITSITTLHASAAGSRAGQTTRPPSPKDPLRRRTPPRPHPRRPATGHRPAPPPRPAPGRRRRPVQRPPRDHQPAHPRHPRPARPGRPHHRARRRSHWPPSTTSTTSSGPQASPSRHEPRQRVDDLQALRC